MDRIAPFISRFLRDERGATMIEYSFVAAMVSITIVLWATQIGETVVTFFQSVANGFG